MVDKTLASFNPIHPWITEPAMASVWSPMLASDAARIGSNTLKFNNKGTFMIVREDEKPLFPIHVSAIVSYFEQRLTEFKNVTALPAHVDPLEAGVMTQEKAKYFNGPWLNCLSEEDFKTWYSAYVQREDVLKNYPNAREFAGPFDV